MARRASVRYWKSRGAYCCWLHGHQHVLAEGPDDYPGPTYQAAVKKFARLTTLANADDAKDENTLRVVCELYMRHVRSHYRPSTHKMRLTCLRPLMPRLGATMIRDLTPHMVSSCLDEMKQWRKNSRTKVPIRWTSGTVALAIQSLRAALNWAVSSGLIATNPLKGLKAPRLRSRGREALIGRTQQEREENHRAILAASRADFRPFLICLEATGCRPGELAAATAKDFREDIGAIVYHAEDTRLEDEFIHKTSRHGKDRTIFLRGEALGIVKDLVSKNRKGPLFLTRKGVPWNMMAIMRRAWAIREKTGLSQFTAYSYRHTYATTWLERGGSVDILAEVMGNTPAVIRKHYSHLFGNAANICQQIDAIRNPAAEAQAYNAPGARQTPLAEEE